MSDMTGTKATRARTGSAPRAARPFCASTISATAPPRAISPRRRSGAGRTTRSPCSTRSPRARRCWWDRAWAAGSCCWRRWRGPSASPALVGIAAAPDATEALMWARFPPVRRARALGAGRGCACRRAIGGGLSHHPHADRGRAAQSLAPARHPDRLPGAAAARHGDPDVPWQTSLELAERIASPDVQ